jgi:thiol-disulfide isomerase/thioredoxin
MGKFKTGIIIAIIAGFALAGCKGGGKKTDLKKTESKPVKLEKVIFYDLAGGQKDFKTLSGGKPVYLTFFASWCAICIKEVEINNKIYKEYSKKGLRVYGVNVGENAETAKRFVAKYKVEYPVLTDPKETASKSVGMIGLPLNLVFDGKSNEIYRDAALPPDDVLKRISGAK